MSSTDERQSSGDVDAPYASFQVQLLPLQGQHEINRILGPVVGCVSSRVARVLLECDAEGEIACVAVDRLTLQSHRVVGRVEPYRPVIFNMTELTPGRTYDLSFQVVLPTQLPVVGFFYFTHISSGGLRLSQGLQNDEPGIFQTPHEHLPAFRLLIVAEDRFLDGTTDVLASFGENLPPSYIGNVVDHFFPVTGMLQANVTVHIGYFVALAHDLQRTYCLLAQDQQKLGDFKLHDSVRSCVRQHWNTPKSQHLLARGAHWFPSIGVLRALLTQEDIPVSFLRVVQRVLAEYEHVGDFRSHCDLSSDRYLYRLQSGVAVLMIDTLEAMLDSEPLAPFVQLPEMLLSSSQWAALEYWLRVDHSQGAQVNQTESANTLVIMCDVPVISQRGESGELREMWHQNSRRNGDVGDSCGHLAVLGTTSWGMYQKEQARLIHMIFRKLHQNPKFHVVFVCCGAFSSRTTITNKSTNLSFQQVVVGPISNSGLSQRREQAGSTEPTFADEELTACYSIQQEIPARTLKSQQYCSLELVPHSLGASSDVKFYTQHLGEARLILGPIIGRVTPRTARILIELDRPVSSLSCALIDPVTLQSYSTKAQVDAFTPTIIKVEGLHPDTRYTIKFESTICKPQPRSQWPQILANGMVSFAAKLAGDASHGNGDTLGDHDDARHQNYNPWHSIEDEYLSEPLSGPQLLLHLGGQVDMSRAFTNEELSSLVVRLAGQVESSAHDEDSDDFQRLRSEVRYRLQEVYRVAWGVPPMNRVLRYTSNLMLLNNDADLYFNQRNICSILEKSGNRSVSDATLTKVVEILRGIAFELWQLYQNQLWVDLAERELKYGSKSSGNKVAFATTFGINRMVVANVSHEVYAYCNTVEAEAQKLLSSGAARSLDEPSSIPAVNLFSAPSWKVIDEALETSSSTPEVGQARAASTRPKNPVQQLVLVISGDLMMWGASKIYPALRTEIVKLFEKLFAWKFVDRVHREVAVICCRKNGSSISFMITDEKLCEKLTLTCVGSISEARELLHRDQKRAKGAVPVIVKGAAISKGFFSKRFSYASITNSTSLGSGLNVSVVEREKQPAAASDIGSQSTTRCRTFVSYRFVSDYRREFFDETLRFFPRVTLPKAVLGPVIGRMVLKEAPKAASDEPLAEGDPGDPVAMSYTVPILLEINAVLAFCIEFRDCTTTPPAAVSFVLERAEHEEEELGQNENELAVDNAFERRDTAQFIQTGEVGIFMCDMRSTLPDDVVTCNNRLVTPLTQQERAVIGEKQWLQLEKALKKKAIMIFVLCMELPLILTDAKHVDAMREEATFPEIDPVQEEAAGRWKLYDRQEISQHWVSCRRQLEQLLNLLFRWKAKHRGRDVIVLSGGMRVGLETMLHDRETKLSVRNLTVGPLTARVESDFANLPLAGVACPTFLGGARDERFTFAHKVVSSKNYLLTHAVVTREQTRVRGTGRAALEVLFEKHQFAEAARMEELRSKHRRRRRGPEELRLSLRAVFAELWKVLPETHRQRVAYFQDEFVFDFLLGYLASDLFEDSEAQDDDVERPPLEFAAFSTLCRDFIFNAGMLNLCLVMQQEDERRALALQRAKARGQAAEREAQRIQQEQQRAEEEAELARLQRENPKNTRNATRERRKAEKLRDVEEELAIAKEQRKLDKLAESGDDPQEFNRRRELLAARVRKLEERKRHRQAEEARRREMKEKKKKEKATH
ncbi:hypothetical protein GQ600_21415 [Phytophthora cactorum]|nr:hypothetical protein GQ600_21415 [Phytophthora cactorum]